MNPNPNPQQVQILGTLIHVDGLKASYHIQKHKQKVMIHPLDAGLDIYATRSGWTTESLSKSVSLINVDTAFHTIFGPGIFAILTSRSSSITNLAGGEVLMGTIDAHYTGEIKVRIKCLTADLAEVESALGKCAIDEVAIAQMIFLQYLFPGMQPKPSSLSGITRGDKGFGSTDRRGDFTK